MPNKILAPKPSSASRQGLKPESHRETGRVLRGHWEPRQCPAPHPVEAEQLVPTCVPKPQLLRTPPGNWLLTWARRPAGHRGTGPSSLRSFCHKNLRKKEGGISRALRPWKWSLFESNASPNLSLQTEAEPSETGSTSVCLENQR